MPYFLAAALWLFPEIVGDAGFLGVQLAHVDSVEVDGAGQAGERVYAGQVPAYLALAFAALSCACPPFRTGRSAPAVVVLAMTGYVAKGIAILTLSIVALVAPPRSTCRTPQALTVR